MAFNVGFDCLLGQMLEIECCAIGEAKPRERGFLEQARPDLRMSREAFRAHARQTLSFSPHLTQSWSPPAMQAGAIAAQPCWMYYSAQLSSVPKPDLLQPPSKHLIPRSRLKRYSRLTK